MAVNEYIKTYFERKQYHKFVCMS